MGFLLKLFTGNPLSMLWIAGGIALAAGAAGGAAAWKVQGYRLDASKDEFALFRGKVESEGRIAEAKAKQQEKDDADRKAKSDGERAALRLKLDGVYAAYGKLRDSRTSSSFLPAATPGAADPNRACFDRAALDRGLAGADGLLQEGALRLLRRGDEAIVDLNSARTWAQSK